jgi:hypothetical protein
MVIEIGVGDVGIAISSSSHNLYFAIRGANIVKKVVTQE